MSHRVHTHTHTHTHTTTDRTTNVLISSNVHYVHLGGDTSHHIRCVIQAYASLAR